MPIAHLRFPATPDCDTDRVENYLTALLKNGQLWGDFLLDTRPTATGLALIASFKIPEIAALDFLSISGHQALAALTAANQLPKIQLQGNAEPSPNWTSARSLYLYTSLVDRSSPLCNGQTGAPLPLYRLPIDDQAREYLYHWQRQYHCQDSIWLYSGPLEAAAYDQLSNPESDLSKQGRSHCSTIETATGLPTYYYLMRYNSDLEPTPEQCPSCGAPWLAEQTPEADDETAFATLRDRAWHDFERRCHPCRLVSN
jgi:predicted  nucleic acid-binding Zn ribbon protein